VVAWRATILQVSSHLRRHATKTTKRVQPRDEKRKSGQKAQRFRADEEVRIRYFDDLRALALLIRSLRAQCCHRSIEHEAPGHDRGGSGTAARLALTPASASVLGSRATAKTC
jgi:hypothetical protein